MSGVRYDPASLASALEVAATLAGRAAADLLAAVIGARGGATGRTLSIDLLEARLPPESGSLTGCLRAADAAFAAAFGFPLLEAPSRWPELAPSLDTDTLMTISRDLALLLDEPLPTPATATTPTLDDASNAWIRAIVELAANGKGHHLALRSTAGTPGIVDFVRLVRAAGATACLAEAPCLAASVALRAELHAGSSRLVVVVGSGALCRDADDGDAADAEPQSPLALACAARGALGIFPALRAIYVWCVPDGRALPAQLDGLVAGCVGPLRFDKRAGAAHIAGLAPRLGPAAAAVLQAMVADPRRVGPALAASAAVAASSGLTMDEGAFLVARSHGVQARRATPGAAPFDPSLVMAEDVQELLDRAPHRSRMGGRVLLVGPPAGGKSSLAFELCSRMSDVAGVVGREGADIIVIAAADILAYRWGDTERLMRGRFQEAASARAPVLVDEMDAFAGVRGDGLDSNNQHLVRCLTDEWLRNLDAHPDVPVVATCNELTALDPAARRRFHLVVEVGDALDPTRERRAWRSILGCEPPAGWRPIGAAVGDMATAAARCRMLGRTSPDDFAEAVRRVRAARLGTSAPRDKGRLH